jgi:hypothetical protein
MEVLGGATGTPGPEVLGSGTAAGMSRLQVPGVQAGTPGVELLQLGSGTAGQLGSGAAASMPWLEALGG